MQLKVNGNIINFTKDYTLLQICDSIGVRIPRFCYNDQMSIAGNCRMCLVELKGAPKPLVSCTSRGIPNMDVYTESPLVKKAREGVMEFLLSNHPLDCPICDQGGECDLQDQSEKFGSDSSRSFLFFRRPVQDKDMGLFIKTIMVRCIHCTRCIRFLKDKALTNDLGTIGRGEKTEISFYFNKFLDKSLLSGNIVDICPVGALTNKNYSFKGRPWEMDEIKYVGISDTLGLNMRLAIKRNTNKILRITPVFSNDTGTKIISDFTRYCIDGFLLDRIENIGFKTNLKAKKPQKLSKKFFKENLYDKLNFHNLFSNDFKTILGSYTSLTSILTLLQNISEKGSQKFTHCSFINNSFNSTYPFLYNCNLTIEKFLNPNHKNSTTYFSKKSYILKDLRHRYFSIGTDFLSEFPVLSSKFLLGFTGYNKFKDSFVLGLLSYRKKNPFFIYKKGLSTASLLDILEGRSALCKNIAKNLNSYLFFSMLLKKRFDGEFLQKFSNSVYYIKNSNGVLSSISSETSYLDLKLSKNSVLNKMNSNWISCLPSFSIKNTNISNLDIHNKVKSNLVLFLGEISEKTNFQFSREPVFLTAFLSSFYSRNTSLKNTEFNKNLLGMLLLPKTFFLEDSFDFLTTLGTYKKNFWSPLMNTDSFKLNFIDLIKSDSLSTKTFLNNFVINSNENLKKSSLRSLPLYLYKDYVYLTEIKTSSKENFFEEDVLLKKSPQLIKLIGFLRSSSNNFKH